jgi:hypothetical protein
MVESCTYWEKGKFGSVTAAQIATGQDLEKCRKEFKKISELYNGYGRSRV